MTTTHTGPLGSTIHVLHANAATVTELAAIDWSRHFRRVCLDPVRGLITLMSHSHPHEDLTTVFVYIVDAAGSALTWATEKLRSLRLRGQGEPLGTGMEPDCAFYVGERAKAYYAVRDEGKAAVYAYVERVAPDLVVEILSNSMTEQPTRGQPTPAAFSTSRVTRWRSGASRAHGHVPTAADRRSLTIRCRSKPSKRILESARSICSGSPTRAVWSSSN